MPLSKPSGGSILYNIKESIIVVADLLKDTADYMLRQNKIDSQEHAHWMSVCDAIFDATTDGP